MSKTLVGPENKVDRKKIKFPAVKQIWILWNSKINDWAIACDDPPRDNAYLWSKSKKAAEALAQHQADCYDIEGLIPVRIR